VVVFSAISLLFFFFYTVIPLSISPSMSGSRFIMVPAAFANISPLVGFNPVCTPTTAMLPVPAIYRLSD